MGSKARVGECTEMALVTEEGHQLEESVYLKERMAPKRHQV